jgi:hypothetical protein
MPGQRPSACPLALTTLPHLMLQQQLLAQPAAVYSCQQTLRIIPAADTCCDGSRLARKVGCVITTGVTEPWFIYLVTTGVPEPWAATMANSICCKATTVVTTGSRATAKGLMLYSTSAFSHRYPAVR